MHLREAKYALMVACRELKNPSSQDAFVKVMTSCTQSGSDSIDFGLHLQKLFSLVHELSSHSSLDIPESAALEREQFMYDGERSSFGTCVLSVLCQVCVRNASLASAEDISWNTPSSLRGLRQVCYSETC